MVEGIYLFGDGKRRGKSFLQIPGNGWVSLQRGVKGSEPKETTVESVLLPSTKEKGGECKESGFRGCQESGSKRPRRNLKSKRDRSKKKIGETTHRRLYVGTQGKHEVNLKGKKPKAVCCGWK